MAESPGKSRTKKPRSPRKTSSRSGAPSGLRRIFRGILMVLGAIGVAALLLGFAVGWVVYLQVANHVHQRMTGQRWEVPTRLYPAPLHLRVKGPVPPGKFSDTLTAMGYQARSATEKVKRSGEFRPAGDGVWFVAPYEPLFPEKGSNTGRLEIKIEGGRVESLRAIDTHTTLRQAHLPGASFAEIHEDLFEARRITPLKDIPLDLRNAVVAIEDERFYKHGALDPLGILRAIYVNLKAGGIVQGGSTLTQQVVKNFFLTQDRTWSRKVKEVLYATALEQAYSKDEILELYLNEIYLGQEGAVSICGMGEAAWRYFSKKPSQLSLAESALLAGMIQGPNLYHPERHTERARTRRDHVLGKMAELKYISDKDRDLARAQPIEVRPGKSALREAPWFVDKVLYDLRSRLPGTELSGAGWMVQTTVDRRILKAAEDALSRGLRNLSKGEALEGAVVVLEPSTGHILALVGGRNYQKSQFNRALMAYRQPGSIFKPLVFAAAMRQLRSQIGPATMLVDEPISVPVSDGPPWKPQNYDRTFRGEVSARRTLEESINIPTVKVAGLVGLGEIVTLARDLGLRSACAEEKTPGAPQDEEATRNCSRNNPEWLHPSLALGAKEVTPLEIAAAYTALANGGVYHPALSVVGVKDQTGHTVLSRASEGGERVLSPTASWLLRDMLRGVLDRGTGKSARTLGYAHPAAGKTGTTSSERDAWFVGFDEDYLVVVWVGYDSNKETGFSGAEAALPIWVDLMKRLRGSVGPSTDPAPEGVSLVDICNESRELATISCLDTTHEAFWSESAPTNKCHLHTPPSLTPDLDAIRRLFDRFQRRNREGAPAPF